MESDGRCMDITRTDVHLPGPEHAFHDSLRKLGWRGEAPAKTHA